jgi:hypothetical protein
MKSRLSFLAATTACAVLVLSCAGTAYSQTTSVPTAETAPAIDPAAHDAALRLLKALELKEKMAAGVDTMVDQGVAAMKAQFPDIRPEFTEEWRKRMKSRINPEDFVAIVAQVYEKHFSADELGQLADTVTTRKEGKTAELPASLKEKFQKDAVAIQSEIVGGTTQLGARIGGEVGQEIGKEHPDWTPPSALKPAQPAK